MSLITVKKRRKIYIQRKKVELRVKGDWYWLHFYLPVFVFFANLFKKGYKKRFMENFITISNFIKPIIYIPINRKGISKQSLEHEVVHLKQMSGLKGIINSLNYLLRPKKRFFYELEAYEVQFRYILEREGGRIPVGDRIKYAKIMSGDVYFRSVSFEFALEEVHKVCDRLEKNVNI